MEYLAKAFEMLKPTNDADARKLLAFLNENYNEMKEIIERIYANKCGNVVVREL